MLEPLGISEIEEHVYRTLLAMRQASLAEVSRELGHASTSRIRAAISSLEQKGLVGRAPGKSLRFIPVPAKAALEGLLARRDAETARVRALASQVIEEYRELPIPGNPMDFVELVIGREAVNERRSQLQLGARRESAALSSPPYASPTLDNEEEKESLGRGVSHRLIYSREALETPGVLESIQMDIALGEEARVLESLPLKLLLVDHQAALVPVSSGKRTIEGAVLISPSALLDGLISLFELLWEKAFPLDLSSATDFSFGENKTGVAGEDAELLVLMVAGLKDAAIAKRLGISPRTLRRRVAKLLDALGAGNRIQAGYLAGKRRDL